ncbi:MAG: hypothetical protein OEY38_04685 [Gammaproteobacteria bacterium]|nr:hypothetical protein [Gammaproteobacteria bacterium]
MLFNKSEKQSLPQTNERRINGEEGRLLEAFCGDLGLISQVQELLQIKNANNQSKSD